MNNLIKIKEMSTRYNVTARTLRYYEDMGLLSSSRSEDYAYRMYDEDAVRRLEQILILRKLNISIKNIQRIFATSDSDLVLEVLGKKVEHIDDEVALLHELREIVLDFIHQIEQVNFSDESDIKLLYDKAKDIETQLSNTSQVKKPNKFERLMKVTDQLDKKVPDILVINIPPFKAITTGVQSWEDMFREGGYMYHLWQMSDLYEPVIFDCFDFLMFKEDKAEWICAIKEGLVQEEFGPFTQCDCPGGLYAMAVSIDEDNESIKKVEAKVRLWIENTNFELDPNRDVMFNMPYLYEEGRDPANKDIEKGLGYKQMQRYFPIKLKDRN